MKKKKGEVLLKLLSALRKNSRMPIAGIAKIIGVPLTTAFEAEKQLRRTGIIKRYYPSFRFEQLGFGIRMLLVLEGENTAELVKDPFLNNLQKISGKRLLAEFIFCKMAQVLEAEERFSGRIISSYYIFEQCKEENAQIIFGNNENFLLF